MNVRQIFVVSILMALVAVMVVKIYPNYPTGKLGVLFYYCTSSHEDRREVKATSAGVAGLPLSPDTQISIIIHGYTESSFRMWVLNLTDVLLVAEPGSLVILVDYWDLVTISRPYMMANTRQIANTTAQFIDLLVEERGVRLGKIHVIGFSLGGRISGLVGDRVKSGSLGRITGLDASYPWLPPKTKDEFLDASDAALVVTLRTSTIGSYSPPGHIDFHANGGHIQPGCSTWYLPKTAEQVCSHYRAVWIMVEAVRDGSGAFPACRCDTRESFVHHSCACETVNHFSLSLNISAHGNFHFSTNATPPYSQPLEHKN
ncbi:endothelial lipase-like isoform X1 [Portunus trituberculatus]|uniref:endothelial lipase-like isoform X1 n=1 Tax=Portunus trituberculatus TaxID=210409 RepID=UPI001E1CF317|nr:endothelial lipase-like isoform X1 [Portunus trituberculatus]XP_045138513.1 endothelial lipase-like isoform X1 [Portunus trituberculatus]